MPLSKVKTGSIATSVTLTSPTFTTPALGTPSALVLTNATGLPQAGLGTNVVGNGSAFSANGTTSIVSSTLTTLTFATEIFDTNNNFASNTFTPTVAGYYQINFGMSYASAPSGQAYCQLRKNNTFYSNAVQSSGGYLSSHTGSVLVYMNGTTDYLTVVCAQFGGTTISADTVINGCLMRAA
jgi:hypothetical protein